MSKHPRDRWGQKYTHAEADGTIVESQIEYVGYGFTEYTITGSVEGVTAAVGSILLRYPSNPYGTWFNWPPGPDGPKNFDGKRTEHRPPVEISPGVWKLTGRHSNSSD